MQPLKQGLKKEILSRQELQTAPEAFGNKSIQWPGAGSHDWDKDGLGLSLGTLTKGKPCREPNLQASLRGPQHPLSVMGPVCTLRSNFLNAFFQFMKRALRVSLGAGKMKKRGNPPHIYHQA